MNRRDLLGLFAGLPFMGWLKPKPDENIEGVLPTSEPFWVDEELPSSEPELRFVVATIGCLKSGSTIGQSAFLYSDSIMWSHKASKWRGFRAKRELRCMDMVTADDFDRLEFIGMHDKP